MQLIRDFVAERIVSEDCGHCSPCWLWSGPLRDGYGRARLANRTLQAHRVSYEAFVGPIEAGLEIDHLCRVRNCVNPDHLEPVTQQENLLRKTIANGYVVGGAVKPRRPRQLKNHCCHGHERTPENTVIAADGWRRCKTCLNAATLRKTQRRSAMRAARRGGGVAEQGRPARCTRDDIARHFEGCQ